MDDNLTLYDKFGRPTEAIKNRSEVHRDGDWHASSHVWFINENNDILLQKRTPLKKLFPNLWIAPVSGHIDAGSDPVSTAIKEAKEELGIDINIDTLFLQGIVRGGFSDSEKGIVENEFIHTFIDLGNYDFNLDIKNDEVDGLKWFSFEEFKSMVENKDPILVPAFEAYELIIAYIKYVRLGGK